MNADWKEILIEVNNSFHEYLTLVNVLQHNKQVWLVLFVELLSELNTVNAYMNEIQSDYHWFVQFYFMVNVDLDTFLLYHASNTIFMVEEHVNNDWYQRIHDWDLFYLNLMRLIQVYNLKRVVYGIYHRDEKERNLFIIWQMNIWFNWYSQILFRNICGIKMNSAILINNK